MVSIPDLQVESGGDLGLRLVPREQGLLARDDDLLLRHQVVAGEDKPPVEVTFPCQRSGTEREGGGLLRKSSKVSGCIFCLELVTKYKRVITDKIQVIPFSFFLNKKNL